MNFRRRLQLARDPQVTVANLVDELVLRKGDCFVSDGEEGPFRLTELLTAVASMDAFLRQTIHLRPGQLVAIYRTNNRLCFHWFLAIIRAGGIAVPLNPQLSLGEVRRILSDSGATILISDSAVFQRTIHQRDALPIHTWIQSEEPGCPVPALDGFARFRMDSESSTPALPPTVIDPAATIAIFHTSGTSGFPKGAALSSNALLGGRNFTAYAGLFLGPNDLALIALPWSHIMAVSIALNGLMAGIRGCFLDRFNVESAVDLVERFGITTFVGVPEMFARLINSQPDPARLRTIRAWFSASDYLPAETRLRLRQFGSLLRLPFGRRIPPVLLNGYGMVELGGLAMLGIELSFAPGSGDFGFPVHPFRIRIVDEDGQPVSNGVTGECQIRRPGLVPHYWKYREKTRFRSSQSDNDLLTPDGWLRTGDLAVRNSFGFIRLVGRIKDVIKSGGYSVYVRELEETLLTHPNVSRAAAFGLPHPEKGEIPVAAVELTPGSRLSESDLIDWCRQNLAGYKSPRRLWILDPGAMPQNYNGKTLRRTLRERFSEQVLEKTS